MNVFTTVVTDIGKVGEKVVHIIGDVVTEGEKVIKVIETAEKLSPQFKADLQTLVNDVKPIASAFAPALAAGGSNVVIDVTALIAVAPQLIELVKDFLSFVPSIEAAFGEVVSDLK